MFRNEWNPAFAGYGMPDESAVPGAEVTVSAMNCPFPPELLEHIFTFADLLSLPTACKANKTLREIVEGSHLIWRPVYLDIFDDPTEALRLRCRNSEADNYDWKANVKRRFRAQTLIDDIVLMKRCNPCQRCDAYRALVEVALTALPHSEERTSKNVPWLRRVYDKELVLHQGLWEPSSLELQLRSQLHVLIGVTNIDIASTKVRYLSREYTYNLNNYTAEQMYGPYLDFSDSPYYSTTNKSSPRSIEDVALEIRVNWTHLRHIHHVFNVNYLERVANPEFLQITSTNPMACDLVRPMNISHIRANSAPSDSPKALIEPDKDWAGVEGRWSCAFCFCDHRVLISRFDDPSPHSRVLIRKIGFNQYLRARNDPDERNLINPFEHPDFNEALRSLDVEFKVLAYGTVPDTYPYPGRPPIHFRGRVVLSEDEDLNTMAAHDANMLGTVTMTGDGEVRWSFVRKLCQRLMEH
jgi:hypothetical protein